MARRRVTRACAHCGEVVELWSDARFCSISCSAKHAAAQRRALGEWERIAVAGDIHVPHHDPVALGLWLHFIAETQPDGVILNGDTADFYRLSAFSKDPRRGETVAEEIRQVRRLLEMIRERVPGAWIRYVTGNHEHRLHRYLIDKAPEMLELITGADSSPLEKVLDLGSVGAELIPCHSDRFTDTFVDLGELLVDHFAMVRAHSGYTAKNLLDKYGVSILQAHVHSAGSSNKLLHSGQVMAWEGGCLCSLKPSYCTPTKWVHAFHMIHRRRAGEFFHVEPVIVLDGRAFYGGRLWQSPGEVTL
jgi:endogenous inhibitor of DNA gyrase (YacG/DUF329 family)